VDFDLKPGAITGLIGPNGAGKTTLFNLVSGTLTPTSGKIIFMDQDITTAPAFVRSRLGMMRTFQNLSLYPDLSCLDNICLGGNACFQPGFLSLLGTKGKSGERKIMESARANLELVGLYDHKDVSPAALSYGNQRRIEIARALTGDPKLLLLDEPAAGLNNQESEDLADLLVGIQKNIGLGILIIEHDMDVLMTISHQVLVLVEGGVLMYDSPQAVQNDPRVIEAYLGREEDFKDLGD
jgi:ABC-type branched-subunit amino acid transport system ATPase component